VVNFTTVEAMVYKIQATFLIRNLEISCSLMIVSWIFKNWGVLQQIANYMLTLKKPKTLGI